MHFLCFDPGVTDCYSQNNTLRSALLTLCRLKAAEFQRDFDEIETCRAVEHSLLTQLEEVSNDLHLANEKEHSLEVENRRLTAEMRRLRQNSSAALANERRSWFSFGSVAA